MDDIYREQLMEHYKNPQNKGVLADPDKQSTKNNPLCGDVITLQLKIDEGGKIEDIKFEGSACAVSIAGASVLTESVKGKSLNEARTFSKDELLDKLGVELTTSRIKCAVLALDTLHDMLEGLDD